MNTTKLLSLTAGLSLLLNSFSIGAPAPAAPGPAAKTSGVKPYPNKTCIVTDNELGSMGPVITKTHKGQQVKFCCRPCVKKFDKNPEKYLKKM